MEESLDSTVGRLDRVVAAVALETDRSEKIQTNLEKHMENYDILEERVSKCDEAYSVFPSQVENRCLRLRKELQGEIDGASELLKTHMERLSTEINFVRQT